MSEDVNGQQETQRAKPVAIDLNMMEQEDELLSIDPNADAFAMPAPPPDGEYVMRMTINKNNSPTGFVGGKDKNDRAYISADFLLTVVKEGSDLNGRTVFDNASTMVMQSSGTCKMAGILKQALKQDVPRNIGRQELARKFQAALVGEPLIGVEIQWQARSQQADGKYKTIARGMKKFPPRVDDEGNPTGDFHAYVKDPNTQEEVQARAVPIRYFPASEVK